MTQACRVQPEVQTPADMGMLLAALTEAAEINKECRARHKSLSTWVKQK